MRIVAAVAFSALLAGALVSQAHAADNLKGVLGRLAGSGHACRGGGLAQAVRRHAAASRRKFG